MHFREEVVLSGWGRVTDFTGGALCGVEGGQETLAADHERLCVLAKGLDLMKG